jgi:hypothetical protein
MPNEFELIFDASTVRESLGLPVESAKTDVVLKMDQPVWAFESANAKPSALVAKLEQEDFADAVAGQLPVPEYALQGFDGLEQFRKVKPVVAPVGTELSVLFTKLGQRKVRVTLEDGTVLLNAGYDLKTDSYSCDGQRYAANKCVSIDFAEIS